MRVIVYGKNVDVTTGLKSTLDKKLSKLDKYFNPDTEATATLSTQKGKHILEVTIPINGTILRAEEATEDMYASIDLAVDKLEGQLRKHKTKLEKKLKDHSTIRIDFSSFSEETKSDEPSLVKTKRFPVKPMSTEEATLQMDLLGHNFFVFLNSDTEEVNVVYKRKDGNYGLIEPTI
ncbi:ribosome hibernation-promoting factor, HPF/YfiA family [Alkalibacter saccharofermentans]|uniref:Ribosome hibernation promoting factor n=1 Tax=Alkalibacter saccharofermentans DSM 14828 TaxID=1120975 RepID=A0A1M4VDU4_9FIRM|nr:ribosome-associated translation inhibitor RaiA [Alkalibacter saccharofermentans]SHE67151.1 putative sigma-54 modulation protein [Alkalibacter saccharofermentans DSM 14828]